MNRYRRARRYSCFTLLLVLLVTVAGCGASPGGGATADYPGGRAIKMIAPAAPGSGWDTTARALAQVLQEEKLINHPLPIENQPGATGAVWLSTMVTQHKGKDDVIALTSLPIMSNELRGDSPYGYKDVTMIARMITEYYMVAVPENSEYKDLNALLDAIKKDAGAVPVGAAGDDRLPFALLVKAAGGDPQKINFVSYEGGGEQIAALLNGDIKTAMAGVSEFRGQIEGGKMRGLAVLKDERLTEPLADIPTAKELGYDVTLGNWRGVYGPPGMSQAAVTYWQDTIEKALQTDAWKEQAAKNQWETTYMEGDELTQYLDKTYQAMQSAMKDTGEIQ